jgi:hypothetical protein
VSEPEGPGEPSGGSAAEPSGGSAGEPSGGSGLRNPAAAVRGVGAAALCVEALVLLLAISPLAKLGGKSSTTAIWLVLVLAAVAVLFVGMLRRPWAWPAATVIPAALIIGGLLHWSLALLGLLFGALWGYVLHVRRTVTSGGSPSASA